LNAVNELGAALFPLFEVMEVVMSGAHIFLITNLKWASFQRESSSWDWMTENPDVPARLLLHVNGPVKSVLEHKIGRSFPYR
jgi:hypothetical protein